MHADSFPRLLAATLYSQVSKERRTNHCNYSTEILKTPFFYILFLLFLLLTKIVISRVDYYLHSAEKQLNWA